MVARKYPTPKHKRLNFTVYRTACGEDKPPYADCWEDVTCERCLALKDKP